jgi:solute carrier family 15 (oligopeptide transporter), member 1
MKSNQSVFGGNQFKLPEQESQLNSFFSTQFFVSKIGLLAGQITIPILRNDVKCLGMDNCFPLAFGLPAVCMLLSFFLLLAGKSFYVHVPPSDNMFVKVCGCIAVSFVTNLS